MALVSRGNVRDFGGGRQQSHARHGRGMPARHRGHDVHARLHGTRGHRAPLAGPFRPDGARLEHAGRRRHRGARIRARTGSAALAARLDRDHARGRRIAGAGAARGCDGVSRQAVHAGRHHRRGTSVATRTRGSAGVNTSTDLKEFLTAYLVEAEEHVALANQRLLALEAAQRSGGHDARALREIFRSLHTIKGLSAMVGVEPVVAIAHRLEAFVRGYDRLGTAPPLRSTDVLLKGVQAIAQRLTALGRGEAANPPPPELLAELDRLDSTQAALAAHSGPELDLEPE